jgi:protein SCO1
LLTFIYTRCPLSDYCPLMSTNFALTEEALGKNRQAYSKTHLLSISFDPKYDTPKVLREYGEAYLQKNGKRAFQHWEFASAPSTEMKEIARFFGLFYEEEKGQIVHSMSTTITSPEGKIYRWYHGNDWKSSDVLNDLASSLADHPGKFAGSK